MILVKDHSVPDPNSLGRHPLTVSPKRLATSLHLRERPSLPTPHEGPSPTRHDLLCADPFVSRLGGRGTFCSHLSGPLGTLHWTVWGGEDPAQSSWGKELCRAVPPSAPGHLGGDPAAQDCLQGLAAKGQIALEMTDLIAVTRAHPALARVWGPAPSSTHVMLLDQH